MIERETLHAGRKFAFERLTIERPGGRRLVRERVKHPGAVVVAPVLGDGRVVLIRTLRMCIGEQGEWLWECCAGTIEPPEAPAACAARELVEETGYRAATLHPLGWFYTTPGMTDERMYAFAATGLEHVGQRLEEDETIEVEAVTAARALEMIELGELRDAKSMLAIAKARAAGLLSG